MFLLFSLFSPENLLLGELLAELLAEDCLGNRGLGNRGLGNRGLCNRSLCRRGLDNRDNRGLDGDSLDLCKNRGSDVVVDLDVHGLVLVVLGEGPVCHVRRERPVELSRVGSVLADDVEDLVAQIELGVLLLLLVQSDDLLDLLELGLQLLILLLQSKSCVGHLDVDLLDLCGHGGVGIGDLLVELCRVLHLRILLGLCEPLDVEPVRVLNVLDACSGLERKVSDCRSSLLLILANLGDAAVGRSLAVGQCEKLADDLKKISETLDVVVGDVLVDSLVIVLLLLDVEGHRHVGKTASVLVEKHGEVDHSLLEG